jgi:signal peptidase II
MRSGNGAPHARLFWTVVVAVLCSDALTKLLAAELLLPPHLPRPVAGDLVRLTLVYNSGAAFGLHFGPHSRWIFTALTVAALVVLAGLYRHTQAGDRWRVLALSLVCGGALGNLVDRLRSARGVVDFIDVGVGTLRWPTFNVADMAVSCGAMLLALVLWREDSQRAPHAAAVSGTDAPVHG